MKLDTLGIDDSAAEGDTDGGEIALERIELQAFLQTDVEYSLERFDKAVGVRRVTQHIVQPDEQIECLLCLLHAPFGSRLLTSTEGSCAMLRCTHYRRGRSCTSHTSFLITPVTLPQDLSTGMIRIY